MNQKAEALAVLDRARRTARTIPGADIGDDLDSLFRTVYRWTESGGRHAKLYQCRTQERAMEFSRLVRDFMQASAILGSSQLYSEGRIFVDFWDDQNSTIGESLDNIYNDMMEGS